MLFLPFFALAVSVRLFGPELPPKKAFEQLCIRRVSELARQNSGSQNAEGLNKIAALLEAKLKAIGLKTTWDFETRSLTASSTAPSPQKTILLVGHFDTVFEPSDPFRKVQTKQEHRRKVFSPVLSGPGVSDDKAGLFMIESLVQLFETSDLSKQIRWKIFLAGDEETASRRSRESLKAFAKESDLALVFEPGWFDFESETPRIATKVGGNLHLSIVVEGSESHPALAEGLGLNTNDVLASIVLELNSLRTHGISVNVFETSGLSKPNVTTSSSKLRVSIRYPQKTDALLIEKFLRRLEKKRYPEGFKVSFNSRTAWKPQTITINGALKLLSRAAKNSGQKAFKPSLTLARSAAAFLSAQGIPTLDNMSPYGEGFHSADEVLYVGSVFDRLKLLRALVLELLKD